MRAFAAYDSEGNGFIAADKLESLVSSLPELRAPPLPELRKRRRRSSQQTSPSGWARGYR